MILTTRDTTTSESVRITSDNPYDRRLYYCAVIAADLYRPEQWTNFFLLVGTGAITLTGLVFVAMSLNLKAIAGDATHRNRAINTLTGLALVFMRCALVLMGGQNHRAIGAELFVVCGISAAMFVKGYVQSASHERRPQALSHRRRKPHPLGRDSSVRHSSSSASWPGSTSQRSPS